MGDKPSGASSSVSTQTITDQSTTVGDIGITGANAASIINSIEQANVFNAEIQSETSQALIRSVVDINDNISKTTQLQTRTVSDITDAFRSSGKPVSLGGTTFAGSASVPVEIGSSGEQNKTFILVSIAAVAAVTALFFKK